MKNIFVGNLDFAATEDSIRSLFQPYGAIERVSVATDRDTGRSKGFGFVEMSSDQEAADAITKFNGADCEGRAMTVNEAKPMVPRENRGGGFGGGNRDRGDRGGFGGRGGRGGRF